MSDDDLHGAREVEQRLRAALEAQARAAVPDRRIPPPIDWPQEKSTRHRWLTPLTIAASVLVVAGAVGGVAVSRRTPTPPPASRTESVSVGPTPSTTSATTRPTTTPTGGATTGGATGAPPAATSSPVTTAPATPATRTVQAGGATVPVPAGWELTPQSTGSEGTTYRSWCLHPSSQPTSTNLHGAPDCHITLITTGVSFPVDPDVPGGFEANPAYCAPPASYLRDPTLKDYSDTTFGGRSAEYRKWVFGCDDGTSTTVLQYEVVTPNPWVLFSEHAAEPGVASVMASVVQGSTLPAATGATRLYDHGMVRSATAQADGSTLVELDRTIVDWPNQSTKVYGYRVPAGVDIRAAGTTVSPKDLVGRTVTLRTEGSDVTSGYVDNR